MEKHGRKFFLKILLLIQYLLGQTLKELVVHPSNWHEMFLPLAIVRSGETRTSIFISRKKDDFYSLNRWDLQKVFFSTLTFHQLRSNYNPVAQRMCRNNQKVSNYHLFFFLWPDQSWSSSNINFTALKEKGIIACFPFNFFQHLIYVLKQPWFSSFFRHFGLANVCLVDLENLLPTFSPLPLSLQVWNVILKTDLFLTDTQKMLDTNVYEFDLADKSFFSLIKSFCTIFQLNYLAIVCWPDQNEEDIVCRYIICHCLCVNRYR